jgi:hypothetical protein
MHIRRLWLALGIVLVPTLVHADDHRMRAFGAPSEAFGSLFAGLYLSGDVSLPVMHKDLGVLGEFSAYSGSNDDVDETNMTVFFGPTWAPKPTMDDNSVFSLHALIGRMRTKRDGGDGEWAWGGAVGGAWDYAPGRAEKPTHKNGFGARVQVDYVWETREETSSFFRASVGGTYTWYPKNP